MTGHRGSVRPCFLDPNHRLRRSAARDDVTLQREFSYRTLQSTIHNLQSTIRNSISAWGEWDNPAFGGDVEHLAGGLGGGGRGGDFERRDFAAKAFDIAELFITGRDNVR